MADKNMSLKQFYIVTYYKLFKVLKIILSIFLVVFFLISLFVLLTSDTFFGTHIAVIESESMVPTYEVGDVVIARESSEYNEDDVITFWPNDKKEETYTHRIVSIEDGAISYKTQGDNNDYPDPFTVKESLVLGKVEKSISGVGDIVLWMRTVPGIILTVIIPATIVFTLYAKDLWVWFEDKYREASN